MLLAAYAPPGDMVLGARVDNEPRPSCRALTALASGSGVLVGTNNLFRVNPFCRQGRDTELRGVPGKLREGAVLFGFWLAKQGSSTQASVFYATFLHLTQTVSCIPFYV